MPRAANARMAPRSPSTGTSGPRATWWGGLLVSLVTIVGIELCAHLALTWLPTRQPLVRFAFEDVWSHARTPFHRTDRDLFWMLVPGFSDGLVQVNAAGLRGPAFERVKDPRTCRILVLGDSIAFGYKVADADTYARRLERLLNRNLARTPGSTFDRVEVLNGGVIGYSSWQGRRAFELRLRELRPDLVIAMFGYNDHHSSVSSDEERNRRRHVDSVLGWAYRLATVRLAFRVRDSTSGTDTGIAPKPRVDVNAFEQNVRAVQGAVRADAGRAVFLTVPVRQRVPLVENFRAVDYQEEGSTRRVWMRQIDFASRVLGAVRLPDIRRHFVESDADLDEFIRAPGACAYANQLAGKYPDFAIFSYLAARCADAVGDIDSARRAWSQCASADGERRDFEAYNSRLRDLALHDSLEVIDVAARFAPRSDLLLDVVHPTVDGHAAIAASIAEHLGSI
jgi:lysophospholipase L1-like esterase